ncbi:helix-turn-helix domain-containing protein [Alkalicoccobacillus porphyridii]|uniref:Helix-turn-helix transcriptional regulator n=1 Tax=Alkalicoccobacillus porphyridii TaxID=2597270 RepID=A0A554A2K9_9BACI|nr:AraC family transcriptional regulator [Alkalicoccobacillus porphyridii]TSB47917.1 helix-turn-helix transcriptional regulator [Alkalicoccobacillus porphyridii]
MTNLGIFNTLSEFVIIRINVASEITHFEGWVESKKHLDYDLWYIEHGEIELRIQNEVFIVREKELVLFSPRIAYTATIISKSCTFTFTHFDFSLGEHTHILDNFDLTGILHRHLVEQEIQMYLEAYLQYKKSIPMSAIRLKGSLTMLLSKIIENYGNGQYTGEFNKYLKDTKNIADDMTNLQPVFTYIQNNYSTSIRIHELATIVGMSEKYFISYFKRAIGVTPGRYIHQLKMNEAKKMLFSKKYTIQQIANTLGYSDAYSFSKSFKTYYKVSPSEFV